MIRILNAEPYGYSPEARAILANLGELVEKPLSQEELIEYVEDFNVLIVRLGLRVDRIVLNVGKQLVAVVTATTGLDHIDVAYAERRGIAVLSLQGEQEFLRSIVATAEHTWALILALLRHIAPAWESVREGRWLRDHFRGNELSGKHLGILGFGRIGQQVADYGLAFKMAVGAYNPYRCDWQENVLRFQSLDDLLTWCDVLTIHLPLNEETRGLIGYEQLQRLPPGAILINTARGDIVDETALVKMLESGHLSGVAVDVLSHEPAPLTRSPLWNYARNRDNVLITPHIGGATWESMARTEVFMARKLELFLVERGYLQKRSEAYLKTLMSRRDTKDDENPPSPL